MNWLRGTGRLGGVALLVLGAVLGLALLLPQVGAGDLRPLLLTLSLSGLLTLGAGYAAARLGWRLRWRGIRFKIAASIAVGIVVALANVAIGARLMFLSSHDLALLAILLSFALLVSFCFGYYLSGGLTSGLRELTAGATRMAEGDLSVRVRVLEGDELGGLAEAFNSMAAQVESAFRRQLELEQARRELIASVSHDLRTPLAALQAMIEALNDGVVSDPDTVARYLRTMQSDVRDLGSLISDLFELSQLDAGVLRLRVEASPIHDLISETLESLRVQAQRKRLHLYDDVDPGFAAVMADHSKVQRVLYNLLQNAIRHTPADGSVVVQARDAGGEVRVSVVDSGEGIPGPT